jgi:hypothetical protein
VATGATSWAATRTAATAPTTIAITIATAAGASVTRAFRTRATRLYRRNHSIHTVEVWLVIRIELCAAFDHCRGRALRRWRHWQRRGRRVRYVVSFRRRSPAAHLGALLF